MPEMSAGQSAAVRMAGLVLAGGRSRRFGSDKAAATLEGRSLLAHAAESMQRTCQWTAVSARPGSSAAALAEAMGLQIVADPQGYPEGPLAGIVAGLEWAETQGADSLAVRPVDTPLLPDEIYGQLRLAMADNPAALCVTRDGPQPLCSVWSLRLLSDLRRIAQSPIHPPIHKLLDRLGAVRLSVANVPAPAFLNINTREEWEWARASLQRSGYALSQDRRPKRLTNAPLMITSSL